VRRDLGERNDLANERQDVARYPLRNLSGSFPQWSPDGQHIYFENRGIQRIPVGIDPNFHVRGSPEYLFGVIGARGMNMAPNSSMVAIVADQAFVARSDERVSSVVWLQNWSDYLKREFAR